MGGKRRFFKLASRILPSSLLIISGYHPIPRCDHRGADVFQYHWLEPSALLCHPTDDYDQSAARPDPHRDGYTGLQCGATWVINADMCQLGDLLLLSFYHQQRPWLSSELWLVISPDHIFHGVGVLVHQREVAKLL